MNSNELLPKTAVIAKDLKVKYYFTGKPCIRGHISKRLASNNVCCQCVKEKRIENIDKARKYAREWIRKWRSENKEKDLENSRRWRNNNPDKCKVIMDKWGSKNKDRLLVIWGNRRARKRNAAGKHTLDDLKIILEKQNNCCFYCKDKFSDIVKKHLDHRIPLSKGGSNGPENLQYLCSHCNLTKYNKDHIIFASRFESNDNSL